MKLFKNLSLVALCSSLYSLMVMTMLDNHTVLFWCFLVFGGMFIGNLMASYKYKGIKVR